MGPFLGKTLEIFSFNFVESLGCGKNYTIEFRSCGIFTAVVVTFAAEHNVPLNLSLYGDFVWSLQHVVRHSLAWVSNPTNA